MSKFESGGSYEEGPTALEQTQRHELLAELAAQRERSAHEAASKEVAEHPELHTMLSKLVESGPEMSGDAKAHLRKMIAFNYRFYDKISDATVAAEEVDFQRLVLQYVGDELQDLDQMVNDGTEQLPDLWDLALEDLVGFRGNGDDEADSPE